jgi:outer membrane receptor protein involved in Fe transport
VNWIDGNSNNVVDAGDTVRFAVARRTTEFGERSTTYDNNGFQMLFGLRGEIVDDWNYDLAFSHGEVDRTNISAGYVSNLRAAVAVNTISSTACTTAAGVTTAGCVPLNLFGKEGSITPAMALYSSVTALEQQNYRQTYGSASVSGPVTGVKSPFAAAPLSVALGGEYREEFGSTTPDDCLRTPAATGGCLGGGGGDALPIVGGFSVKEYFGEAILPLISDKALAHSMNLELGYRYGDYDPSGINRTWKAGLNWAVTEDFRVRVMAQRAARAPNVGELYAPQRTGLANATSDPCSNANATALAANAALRTRCLSTGMSAAQVGTVTDIIAGQVNVFVGTNQNLRPAPEIADTRTYGFVWRPSFLPVLKSPTISVDYYSIDIDDYIGTLAAQQVLDGCYANGDTGLCNLITRSGGTLVFAGSGIATYNTNLLNVKAEGIDLGVNFGLDLPENFGSMSFAYNATFASALEFQASTGIARVDCLGFYGNACDPLTSGNPAPEYKHVARATWEIGGLTTSALWRRIGETAVLPGQRAATFAQFRETKAFDYFDFTGSYTLNKNFELTAAVINAFNTDPPILGGDIGPTSSNGGNTFPQVYDTVGAVWSLGGRVKF